MFFLYLVRHLSNFEYFSQIHKWLIRLHYTNAGHVNMNFNSRQTYDAIDCPLSSVQSSMEFMCATIVSIGRALKQSCSLQLLARSHTPSLFQKCIHAHPAVNKSQGRMCHYGIGTKNGPTYASRHQQSQSTASIVTTACSFNAQYAMC